MEKEEKPESTDEAEFPADESAEEPKVEGSSVSEEADQNPEQPLDAEE